MSWLRIDDGFTQHPKFAGWTTVEKWALLELLVYCARYRTAGRVPDDLALLPRSLTRKVLDKAVDSGFVDNLDGTLWIHDWKDYNPADPTASIRMQRYRARNADRNDERNAVEETSVENGEQTVTPTVTPPSTRAQARARVPVPSPTTKTPTVGRTSTELRGGDADRPTDDISTISDQVEAARAELLGEAHDE